MQSLTIKQNDDAFAPTPALSQPPTKTETSPTYTPVRWVDAFNLFFS
jgi:hypothetical protein